MVGGKEEVKGFTRSSHDLILTTAIENTQSIPWQHLLLHF
jgi:hypothetical protein